MRSAFAVGQARGAVLAAAGARDVPCFSYTPQAVKLAVCGSGAAGKDQVQRMVGGAAGAGRRRPTPTTPPTRSRSRSATRSGRSTPVEGVRARAQNPNT